MKQDRSSLRAGLRLVTLLVVLIFVCGCGNLPRRYRLEESSPAYSKTTRLDINQASSAELERLPGIGKVMAERIVAHRLKHGQFRRVEHLMSVRGISERKLHQISRFISVQ